ncbi:MAG: hypothetical protein JXA77_07815 [Bacteroidales bacterium]|nr:hypothetical protein [Bacteroidales bacterium]MBN2819528.1 hypothetical protein [Bacteroidales bacterium]
MKKVFILLQLFFSIGIAAQPGLYFGSQVPLTYTIGADFKTNYNIAVGMHLGGIAYPYKEAILGIMELGGADETLTNTIGHAFTSGYSMQPELMYYKNNWKVGLIYSFFYLRADDTPLNVIDNYYGFNLSDYRLLRFIDNFYYLTLYSELHCAGIKAGYNFNLPFEGIEIHTDFDFMKIIASNSYVYRNEDEYLDVLSENVNEKLDYHYLKYGYLPSVNIKILYRFNFLYKNNTEE